MASYLDVHNRKRRQSKLIIDRNNARRKELILKEQLFLKQERPDVENISEESDDEVPAEERVYWRRDQSSGYNSLLRWMRGERGYYYYDGREGSRTFGDSIPEGFISQREFDTVSRQFNVLLPNENDESVRRELQNPESSLSFTWRAAVTGTYRATPPDALSGTNMELMNGLMDRQGLGTGHDALEEAGRRLGRGAEILRDEQTEELAAGGVFTTDYVNQTAIEEGDLEDVPEEEEEEEEGVEEEEDDNEESLGTEANSGFTWRAIPELADLRDEIVEEIDPNEQYPEDEVNTTADRMFDERTGNNWYVYGTRTSTGYGYVAIVTSPVTMTRYQSDSYTSPMMLLTAQNANVELWELEADGSRTNTTIEMGEEGIFGPDSTMRDLLEVMGEGDSGIDEPTEPTEDGEQRPKEAWARIIPDMSVEEYESLSDWGKQSLSTAETIRDNEQMWGESPFVIIVDPGDAKNAATYDRINVTVREPSPGRPFKATSKGRRGVNWVTGMPRGKFDAANEAIDIHNDAVNSITSSPDAAQNMRDYLEDRGEEERLYKKATKLSFKDWIIERDNTFQLQLNRSRNAQDENLSKYGNYFHPRISNFEAQGNDVIGVPTHEWLHQFGDDVYEREKKIKQMLQLSIPANIPLLPPILTDADLDDPAVYRRTDRIMNLSDVLAQWYEFNLNVLRTRDAVSHDNEKNGQWGHRRVQSAVRDIENGQVSQKIVSLDGNMELGAMLSFHKSGTEWSIGVAGANLKNFSSYPYQNIDTALKMIIRATRGDNTQVGTTGVAANKYWRGIRNNWNEYGKPHPSATLRETPQRRHGQWVFQEFARKFLKEGGQTVSTMGLSNYVTEKYKEYGFVDGHNASRLNILWTLAYFAPDWIPHDSEGNLIEKSFVAYSETHDTIIKEPRLDTLQWMLNDLIMKNNKEPELSEERLAQWDEEDAQRQMEWLGLTEEEYAEFIESFNGVLSGTGNPDAEEKDE